MVGNDAIFIGRLTADPEIKEISDTFKVADFTLARNRYSKDKEHPQADFIDFVAMNQHAEFLVKYFKKGQKVGVQGELRSSTYTDKDGNKRKKTEVIVNNFEFIDSKSQSEASTSSDETANEDTSAKNETPDDDELPF